MSWPKRYQNPLNKKLRVQSRWCVEHSHHVVTILRPHILCYLHSLILLDSFPLSMMTSFSLSGRHWHLFHQLSPHLVHLISHLAHMLKPAQCQSLHLMLYAPWGFFVFHASSPSLLQKHTLFSFRFKFTLPIVFLFQIILIYFLENRSVNTINNTNTSLLKLTNDTQFTQIIKGIWTVHARRPGL